MPISDKPKMVAEFADGATALNAHRALVDGGVAPHDIELRSPYPLAEEAIPPHRTTPMRMRWTVRILWAVGILSGFSFLAWTQLWWGIRTDWQPIVPVPMNAIITYECGMISAILTTTFMFFFETRHYRRLTPPLEEDLPVAQGHIALVVEGDESVRQAERILADKGALSVVKYGLVLLLGLAGLGLTGCAGENMRQQAVAKPTEAEALPPALDSVQMPTAWQQAVPPPAGLGWLAWGELKSYQFAPVPPAVASIANPVAASAPSPPGALGKTSLENGQILYRVNCAMCHGPQGRGDGPVGLSYTQPPADLTAPGVARAKDGTLYFYIMRGGRMGAFMPPFGDSLSPRQIWDVVNYLRSLQARAGTAPAPASSPEAAPQGQGAGETSGASPPAPTSPQGEGAAAGESPAATSPSPPGAAPAGAGGG
ncbi:MAG TPA: cytochrome c, partial [Candidatus Nitrosotenuis sp.]|nr:cytochrome c [Candidatus Nitrosotenuis sp.]